MPVLSKKHFFFSGSSDFVVVVDVCVASTSNSIFSFLSLSLLHWERALSLANWSWYFLALNILSFRGSISYVLRRLFYRLFIFFADTSCNNCLLSYFFSTVRIFFVLPILGNKMCSVLILQYFGMLIYKNFVIKNHQTLNRMFYILLCNSMQWVSLSLILLSIFVNTCLALFWHN